MKKNETLTQKNTKVSQKVSKTKPKSQTLTTKTAKVNQKVTENEKKSQTLTKNEPKVPLGIVIPYYKNSEQCEICFKTLIEKIKHQLNDNTLVLIVEDGQQSDWLNSYENEKLKVFRNKTNKGVSNARNQGIDYFMDKTNYIAFIDSDDDIADNYIEKMSNYAGDNTHDILEANVNVNGVFSSNSEPYKHRNCVWSYAFRTSAIGENRFNENLQYGEDTDFIYRVIDFSKHRKVNVPTTYFYVYGRNPNSLAKMYSENRITKSR